MSGGSPFYHFSVDDVLAAPVQVSDRGIGVLEHPLYGFLADLHAEFGTRTDLYLFARHDVDGARRCLTEVSARNRAEYEELEWLRMGPHAHDRDTPPHAQPPAEAVATFEGIYTEIERFAGPAAWCQWLRLHQFSECYECADYLRERGVRALMLTDKDVHSYRLPEVSRDQLRRRGRTWHAGLDCVRSHVRLEHLVRDRCTGALLEARIDAVVGAHGFAAVFTHECDLREPAIRDMAHACAALFQRRGVACSLP